jgi:hypothetical protein
MLTTGILSLNKGLALRYTVVVRARVCSFTRPERPPDNGEALGPSPVEVEMNQLSFLTPSPELVAAKAASLSGLNVKPERYG